MNELFTKEEVYLELLLFFNKKLYEDKIIAIQEYKRLENKILRDINCRK